MAVPQDIMQALMQGGGGAPAPAAGPMGGPEAIPPDLMAMLGGGGGMPPEAGMEQEAGPSIVDGEPGGGEDALVLALDALQDAIDNEADQEDIQVMLQCQAKLQQILAKNQAEADSMMQGKMTPRGLRKAL